MAELFGQYDPPSPCVTTFCKRVTVEHFEKEASEHTGKALEELLAHLEYNPAAYYNVLRKRKKEELESSGVFSFIRTKVLTSFRGIDEAVKLSPSERRKRLGVLKDEIRDAFDYSQESRGYERRFSKRLAQQRVRSTIMTSTPNTSPNTGESNNCCDTPVMTGRDDQHNKHTRQSTPHSKRESTPIRSTGVLSREDRLSDNVFITPIPPPPPPPPPPVPLSQTNKNLPTTTSFQDEVMLGRKQLRETKAQSSRGSSGRKSATANKENHFTQLLTSIQAGSVRQALKPVAREDDDDTPERASRKRRLKQSGNDSTMSMFNQQLVEKFRNVKSPNASMLSLDYSPESSFSV